MSTSSRVIALLFLCTIASVDAAIKGSESAVSIEANYMFPAADNNNKIAGFAWFKNGFSLEDATTTLTFDSVYPVSGDVDFAGGTVTLLQDFVFKNNTNLLGFGSVVGNNYHLELCSSVTHLPANSKDLTDVTLILNDDLQIEGTVTCKGSCTIVGDSNTLKLAENGKLIVASGASLELRNLTVAGIQDSKIYCADNTASLVLDTVQWQLEDNFTFSLGSINFVDTVDLVGSATFTYSSSRTSTIAHSSCLNVSEGVHLAIGKTSATSAQPLYFTDSSSDLRFDSSSLTVGQYGMQLTRGKVVFDRDVAIDILGTNTTNGIILGDGTADNDVVVQYNSGSSVTLKSGYFVYNDYAPHNIKATSKSAKLARTINSKVYLAQSVVLPEMIIQVLSNYTPPMEIVAGKTLTYDNTCILLPNAAFDVRSDRYDQMTFYLNGADSLFLTKGVFPLNILVTNSLNRLQGNGSIVSNITLENSGAQLIANFQGLINKDIAMNGGTIKLENDFTFGALASFDGIGTVDLDKFNVSLGSRDSVWTGTTSWHGTDGSITLNAKLSLTSTNNFSGDITINGDGNTLDLGATGAIVIADGAKLTLKNILLDNVHGTNISCLGNSSSLVLDDVEWVQTADATFGAGSLEIVNKVEFAGAHNFAYDSNQTSSIRAHSEWHFKDQMTATLGKHSNGNQPIWFEDTSAVWHFSHANIHVTNQGLQLTHGTIFFDHEIMVDIDSTSTANGVIFGAGSAQDDFIVQYNAGATVYTNTGHITFNNISLPSVVPTAHKGARLMRRNGSYMYFAQSMTLPAMTIQLESNSVPPIVIAAGKTVLYNDVNVVTKDVEFDLTGQLINYYSYGLFGNKSMFLSKGILPLYTVAAGPGNILHGTGSISGAIILSGPTTALSYGVNGYLSNYIALNGGSLTLLSNLDFAGTAGINGPGNVYLGSLGVHFGQGGTSSTTPLHWYGSNAAIELNSQLTLASTWTIDGQITLDGKRNLVDFETGGKLYVTPGSTLILKDITLYGVTGDVLECADDSAKIVFDNAELIQTGDYTFSKGSIVFRNDVMCRGAHNFVYASSRTSTIEDYSTWRMADQMHLHIGRQQLAGAEPLYFEDGTSVLNFNNASFIVTASGIHLKRGKLELEHEVVIDVASTTTTYGLIAGDGQVENDFLLQFNAGSTAKHIHGYVTLRNSSAGTFKSVAHTSGRLYRGNQSHLYIDQNIVSPPLTIVMESLYVPPLVKSDSSTITYDKVVVALPDVEYELQGSLYNAYTNLLAYGQAVTLSKGTLPVYLLVVGPGNIIRGNGSVAGMIILADSSSQITYSLNGFMLNNIMLNGGTLTLANALSLDRGALIVGPGNVNIGTSSVKLGSKDLVWPTSIAWQGSNSKLELNAELSLMSTWTFEGNCILQGNGNTLDLGTTGRICVAPGAHLQLKNITLKNVHDENVFCVDDTGKLTLDKVIWKQNGDYSFAEGSFLIENKVTMKGRSQFAYQTSRTSTLAAHSQLVLDEGFTFSYDPEIASKDLLAFVDGTAQLILNGATLHTTRTGMTLTDGKLVAQLNAKLSAEVLKSGEYVLIDEGFTFGAGAAEDDMAIEVFAGANLALTSGSLHYNNMSVNSLYMRGGTARLTISDDTVLHAMQDLNLGDGVMYLSSRGTCDVAEGKNIEGAVFVVS